MYFITLIKWKWVLILLVSCYGLGLWVWCVLPGFRRGCGGLVAFAKCLLRKVVVKTCNAWRLFVGDVFARGFGFDCLWVVRV